MINQSSQAEPDFSLYSDIHKDAYGFRPRSPFVGTKEEYIKEIEYLGNMITEQEAADRIAYKQAFKEWKAHIRKLSSDFDISLFTAMCWDLEAMECIWEGYPDIDHYFYKHHTSYRVSHYFTKWYRRHKRGE